MNQPTCLTCRYRAPIGPTMPEANASLYRCVRFPKHEIHEAAKLLTHGCGEHEPIDYDDLVRYVLTHAH